MAKGGAWKWVLGMLGVAGFGAAVLGGGSASADEPDPEPKVPDPHPPIPPPEPDATSAPGPDVLELVDAEDFVAAEVLAVIDPVAAQRTHVPRTVLLGYSEGWTGKDATLARVLELAPAHPDVQFVVFSFATSRELFGQPDAPIAFVATAVDPDGVPRASDDHFVSANLGAPALGDARWGSLIDYARKGYGWQPGWVLDVREYQGKSYTILLRPAKVGQGWEWLVWQGPRASDLKALRRGVHLGQDGAAAKAREAIASL